MDESWWRGLTECGPLEKGLASHFSILDLRTPMNSMKRQKDRTLKDEFPRLVGTQYVTGDQWRNNSRKNEVKEPKQRQHTVVGGTGDRAAAAAPRSMSLDYTVLLPLIFASLLFSLYIFNCRRSLLLFYFFSSIVS